MEDRDEMEELFKKHAHDKVNFDSWHKHSFLYKNGEVAVAVNGYDSRNEFAKVMEVHELHEMCPEDTFIHGIGGKKNGLSDMPNHDLLVASIIHIGREIERVMWNVTQNEYHAPTGNYGTTFEIPEFKMRAYDWNWDMESDEDDPLPNFEWRDYKLWWYKHLGRGDYANRQITNDELAEMVRECRSAVAELESYLDGREGFFRSEKWLEEEFIDPERHIRIR